MNQSYINGERSITFRPIDVHDLPILQVSLATKYGFNEGLSPRTSARFMYNWILPMPDLPIANQYIADHPQTSLFQFELLSLASWTEQTGGNSRILMRALESSGRPPLFWKTQVKLQPLVSRPWVGDEDSESSEHNSPTHIESPNIEEEQEEIDEESLYHAQMDVWEMNMIRSDNHSVEEIQDFLNQQIVCFELSECTAPPINTRAPNTPGEMNLSAVDDDMETSL